jgi:hypothetical protein
MSNYPTGAKYDPSAPYNQPSDIKYKRFVSLTISYYDTIEAPPDLNEEEIKSLFIEKIKEAIKDREIDIDELIILDD